MNDLISRKDALSLLTVFTEKDALGSTPAEIIKHMPFADPVVHGHWIDNINWDISCSVCGYVLNEDAIIFKYCPHCGAKIDEVTE